MPALIRLIRAATADLARILAHSRRRFGVQVVADLRRRVFDRLETMSAVPLSGPVPPELEGLGDERLREVVLAPHRVLYFAEPAGPVLVFAMADGRRDLAELLIQRALTLPRAH